MNSKRSKLILIIGVVAVLVLIGWYFLQSSNNFQQENLLLSNANTGIDMTNDVVRSEAYFLEQINRLQQVNLDDVEILSSKELNSLSDNTVIIPEFDRGRDNPFAPIDARVQLEFYNNFTPVIPDSDEVSLDSTSTDNG